MLSSREDFDHHHHNGHNLHSHHEPEDIISYDDDENRNNIISSAEYAASPKTSCHKKTCTRKYHAVHHKRRKHHHQHRIGILVLCATVWCAVAALAVVLAMYTIYIQLLSPKQRPLTPPPVTPYLPYMQCLTRHTPKSEIPVGMALPRWDKIEFPGTRYLYICAYDGSNTNLLKRINLENNHGVGCALLYGRDQTAVPISLTEMSRVADEINSTYILNYDWFNQLLPFYDQLDHLSSEWLRDSRIIGQLYDVQAHATAAGPQLMQQAHSICKRGFFVAIRFTDVVNNDKYIDESAFMKVGIEMIIYNYFLMDDEGTNCDAEGFGKFKKFVNNTTLYHESSSNSRTFAITSQYPKDYGGIMAIGGGNCESDNVIKNTLQICEVAENIKSVALVTVFFTKESSESFNQCNVDNVILFHETISKR